MTAKDPAGHPLFRTALVLIALLLTAALLVWWGGGPEGVAPPATTADPGAAAEPDGTGENGGAGTTPAEDDSTGGDAAQAARTNAPAGRLVRGRLVGATDVPVAGVEVLAFAGRPEDKSPSLRSLMSQPISADPIDPLRNLLLRTIGEPLARTEAAADGSFALRLDPEDQHLRVTVRDDLYRLPLPIPVHLEPWREGMAAVDLQLDLGDLQLDLGAALTVRIESDLPVADTAPWRVVVTSEPDPGRMMQDPSSMFAKMAGLAEPATAVIGTERVAEFRALPAGSGQSLALARKPKASGWLQASDFSLRPGERREIRAIVSRGAGVQVIVVDPDGAPIGDAKVVAVPEGLPGAFSLPHRIRSVQTAADGTAALIGLRPGGWSLDVDAAGYVVAARDLTLEAGAPDQELRFVLDPGGSVAGRVIAAATGEPIAGAQVAYMPEIRVPILGDVVGNRASDALTEAAAESPFETDADGRFVIRGLADGGTFHIVAHHDSWQGGVASGVRMGADAVLLELRRPGTVTGQLVAAGDGDAIPDFDVAVVVREFLFLERPLCSTSVRGAGSGAFRLEGVPPGDHTLEFRTPDERLLRTTIQVSEGATTDVGDIAMPGPTAVTGVVTDPDGNPVAGAAVRERAPGLAGNPILADMLGRNAARTDSEGRYTFRGLGSGTRILTATAPGFAPGNSARFESAAGITAEGVDITLGAGGVVTGRVLLPVGMDAADWSIWPNRMPMGADRSQPLAADGSFRFEGLEPGSYILEAGDMRASQAMGADSSMRFRRGQPLDLSGMMELMNNKMVRERITVRAGETLEVELDATDLGDADGQGIEVRATLGGQPVQDAILEVSPATGGMQMVPMVNGLALCGAVPAGPVTLQVRHGITVQPLGSPQTVEITGDGPQEFTIALPGGSLAGRVLGPDGTPLVGIAVRLLDGDEVAVASSQPAFTATDQDGEFRFAGLGAGTYGLVAGNMFVGFATAPSAAKVTGLDLADGEQRRGIVLRSEPEAGLEVTVRNTVGGAVAGASCVAVDEAGRPLGTMGTWFTGSDGTALLLGLPAGPVQVLVRAEGYSPANSTQVTVAAGQSLPLNVQLEDGPDVNITVRTEDGRLLRGVAIRGRRQSGSRWGPWVPAPLLVQGTGSDGSVAVGALAPGRWEFEVAHPAIGRYSTTRSIRPGRSLSFEVTVR